MKFYRLALWKTYFDIGYGLMSYPKWVMAIFGIGEIVNKNYWVVIIGAFIFLTLAFVFGYVVIKSGFLQALNEVQNRHNLFMKQVRDSKILKG